MGAVEIPRAEYLSRLADAILRKAGKGNNRIENDLLPVDVEVVEYMDNSDIAVAQPGRLTERRWPMLVGRGCASAAAGIELIAERLVESAGLRAAITGMGDSPLRPRIAWKRSACSVFVGKPVLGPPR